MQDRWQHLLIRRTQPSGSLVHAQILLRVFLLHTRMYPRIVCSIAPQSSHRRAVHHDLGVEPMKIAGC